MVLFFTLFGLETYLLERGFQYELRARVLVRTANNEKVLDSNVIDKDLMWVHKRYQEVLKRAEGKDVHIAFMGDSCTEFGKYHDLLKGLLQRKTGKEVNIVNLGVAGWSTFQGLVQMERDVARLKPGIVTIYFGWNDHWASMGLTDREVQKINRTPLYLVQRFRTGQLITKCYVGLAAEDDGFIPRVPEEDFRENLRQMVLKAREMGSTPILITAPTSHEKGREPAYLATAQMPDLTQLVPVHQKYAAAVREVAAEERVLLCDLAEHFDALPGKDLRKKYFHLDGIHPKPAGDQRIAEFMLELFERSGLIDKTFR